MKWLGEKLKEIVCSSKFTQSQISEQLEVSRQTYVDWTKGQVPKGNHLLKLCRLLKLDPTELFVEEQANIAIPLHMTRGTAKLTEERQERSLKLSKEYERIINSSKAPVLQFSVKSIVYEDAVKLAQRLRELAGLDNENTKPLDYNHVFKLIYELGICLVFRCFPEDIKSYGFYTVIKKQKTIFINTSTNVIDLIFPILHELVHAIIDRNVIKDNGSVEEENFCHKVASLAQFPEEYVSFIYENIKGLPISHKVNTLKTYSITNHHAMFGIMKCIEEKYGKLNIKIGGADTNLKKELPVIKDILSNNKEPEEFLNVYKTLSPIFYMLLLENYDNLTNRKLAEILDLDNSLDAVEIRKVLDKQKRLITKC